MTQKSLLEKSRNYRNDQAIQHLAQRDALKAWGLSRNELELPKVEIIKVKSNSAGWINFFKELRP